MKKISVILLLLLSTVCFTACNNASNIKGEFLNNEYIFSLEEVKDFYDELNLQGIEKDKLDFVSSNDQILLNVDRGEFKAVSSGQTYIFARYQNRTVAKAKVKVKYKLSTPQNFNLSEEGVLTWDKSYAVVNGEKQFANEYKFQVGEIIAGQEQVIYNEQILQENTYTFANKGSYSIKVTALGDENIDNSNEVEKVFHYGTMGEIDEVVFTSSDEFDSQQATFTWKGKTNAQYDIYVEGFKLASDIEEEVFSFDYSIYAGGKQIQVDIIAKDKNNEKIPCKTSLAIEVLNTPELSYSFDARKEGKLVWESDADAVSYILKIVNQGGDITYKNIDKSSKEDILEGLGENIYQVSLKAIGGENSGYFVSSKPSNTVKVAKVSTPNVEVTFEEKQAKLTFEYSEYVTDYKISWYTKSIYYSVTNGLETYIDLSEVPTGERIIEITALPQADGTNQNTGVKPYHFNKEECDKVINSDPLTKNYFALNEIGEIIHVLNENTSTFTFQEITNADQYHLYINDILVNDVNQYGGSGLVTLSMNDLKNYSPKDGGYDVKIVADRSDGMALESQKVKRLEILDAPQAKPTQENGSFKWIGLEEECKYTYEVYKTESDYTLTVGQTPILKEEETDALQISQVLTEGYYKIKVKAVSINENLYLNSDFYDENNILDVNFVVTKALEIPQASFLVEDDKYKLNITTVDNASQYEVYVNGSVDGIISDSELETEEYIFNAKFIAVERYEVKIVARAGALHDGNIYQDSQACLIYVNRLAPAEENTTIEYTDFDRANHQWIEISQAEHSKSVRFFLDGSEVESEYDYKLDVANESIFGSTFKIGLIVQGGEKVDNNYYIDSHLQEITFTRASFPSQIKYTSGNLTWTQNQTNAEKNLISLIVKTASTSDYYHRFEVSVDNTEFDLQTYINNIRKSDLAFDTAFRQMEKLQIRMLSYMNDNDAENHWFIPSSYGTTVGTGNTTLEINRLATPTLTFDSETEVISWGYDIGGCVFDIYVDDKLVKEGYSLSKSISLEELGGDYTVQKKINIRARGENYLDSEISSPIRIKRLVTPTTIHIAKDGTDYRASILLNADNNFISAVHVNSSANNVTFSTGDNIASFLLSNFSDVTEFAVSLIAQNEGDSNYFISSQPFTFSLKNFAEQTFEARLTTDKIEWDALGADINGNNKNPIRYILTFTNDGKTYNKTFTDETSVELAQLQTIAGQLLAVGEVKAKVKAIIDLDYSISGDGALGYYGSHESEELTTNKLNQITAVNVEVLDGNGDTEIEKKQNSFLQIEFENKWKDFTDVSFKLDIDLGGVSSISPILPSTGTASAYFLFSLLENSEYQLVITPLVLQSLTSSSLKVKFQAICDNQISSEIFEFEISKFANTSSAEVLNEGSLVINDTQEDASYLVKVSVGDQIIEGTLLASEGSKVLNLMTEEFLLNRYGAFTIDILTFDENSQMLPATTTKQISGYKLEGIKNLRIDNSNFIFFEYYADDLNGIELYAKYLGKEVKIGTYSDDGVGYHCKISNLIKSFECNLIEGVYTFEFSIRKDGSINSDWKSIDVDYRIENQPTIVKGADLDKTYVLMPIIEGIDEVCLFVSDFSKVLGHGYGNAISVNDLLGYWCVDENGENGYFSKTAGTESGWTYTQCYGIDLSEHFKNEGFETYMKLEIYRTARIEDKIIQYNVFEIDFYKLNKIKDEADDESFTIKDNLLNFSWECSEHGNSEIKPTAYYIYFKNEGIIEKRAITYTHALDLRTVGLTPGEIYDIYVKAVSADKMVLASNMSNPIESMRYTAPLSIEITDGIITLNKEEFKNSEFMQDIIEYFGQTTEENIYHSMVGTKTYNSPSYFDIGLFGEMQYTFQFVKVDATGAPTNTVYTVKIPIYHLFPDFEIEFNLSDYIEIGKDNKESWQTLLQKYAILKLDNPTTLEEKNVAYMIEIMKNASNGIGDKALLFDDFGRTIPAGEYLVSLIQSSFDQNIESNSSEAIKMYISASPQVSIQSETIGSMTQYTVNCTPTMTMNYNYGDSAYQLGVATRYKLLLRPIIEEKYDKNGSLGFVISYNDTLGQWEIFYNDALLDDVITNHTPSSKNGLVGFKINMSAIRKKVNQLTGEETILANQLMRADIFTFAQNDEFVVNGKSGVFNINYLDLNATVKFNNGQLTLEAPIDENYDLLVKYKYLYQGLQEFTTRFKDYVAKIDLKEAGVYEYVVLALRGSISNNTLNVESPSYAIQNLYKLSSPNLTTSNSNIVISYVSSDTNYIGEDAIQFNMANDVSLSETYSGDDKGYYYQSAIRKGSVLEPYVAGSVDADGNTVYASELSANEFFSYLGGNSGNLTLSPEGCDMADYLLVFDHTWAVMSSDVSSIRAKMLPNITSYSVSEGDIVSVVAGLGIGDIVLTNYMGEENSASTLFEVTVYYYAEDNENPGQDLHLAIETFYSANIDKVTTDHLEYRFEAINFDKMYDYFMIFVTMIGGVKSTNQTTGAIKTIEGEYFLLGQNVLFEDGTRALKGQTYSTYEIYTRTDNPYLVESENGNGIKEGKISFVIDKDLYYAEENTADVDTAKRIRIYAERNQTLTRLSGQTIFRTSTQAGQEDMVFVSFIPDEGQLNESNESFNIKIYIYGKDASGNDTLLSNSLEISKVYKLPKLDNHYTLGPEGNQTRIDLSNYFQNVSFNDDNSCYSIILTYVVNDEPNTTQFSSASPVQHFLIPLEATQIVIQAQDSQDETQTNRKKLLYSDTKVFNIQKTDVEGLSVKWMSDEMRFEWTWADGREDNYEYYVSITTTDEGKHKTVTSTEVVATQYYYPKMIGTIETGKFTIRARKLDTVDTENLYVYSQAVAYTGDNVVYQLFSSGDGTKANPYEIANITDFQHMALRNTSDFYFRLVENLEISCSDLLVDANAQNFYIKDFNAHLDGRNSSGIKTITFTANKIFEMEDDERFSSNIVGQGNDIIFGYYSSMFYKLTSTASISNINVVYNVTYNFTGDSLNVLFAPLCAYNYGIIENVNISSSTMSITGAENTDYMAFVGGLASVNYGTIKNCYNKVQLEYIMAQKLQLTFGYAGISTFNAKIATFEGKIENCFNIADKSTKSENGNFVYMAGISLVNTSLISKSGNDAMLSLVAKKDIVSMTGYYGGVVIENKSGTLEFVYNNGEIKKDSSVGELSYGGVAYSISGGTIKNLVTTVGDQPLVKVCSQSPTNNGTNYAPAGSGTAVGITTIVLSAQTIDCGDGYKLKIVDNNGWKASITK